MAYLVAFAVLLGLVNLVFTLGVVRRLRQHSDTLSTLLGGASGTRRDLLGVGAVVGDFAVQALDGTPITRDSLSGHSLVGFFSPGCDPCADLLPHFIERARDLPAERVLAVLDGMAPSGVKEYASGLSAVGRVVVDDPSGPVQRAFGVEGFPAVFFIGPSAEVLFSGADLAGLPGGVR
ncbi:TlpA family protein disulfide reductase [Nonomuraea sp. NPDC001831]|uniref:TlpA family protein disulfide reductase n=1 Tax=Nonomuraea sp. NPDC001831 TaxID=3364340 RepID=UPI003696D132